MIEYSVEDSSTLPMKSTASWALPTMALSKSLEAVDDFTPLNLLVSESMEALVSVSRFCLADFGAASAVLRDCAASGFTFLTVFFMVPSFQRAVGERRSVHLLPSSSG